MLRCGSVRFSDSVQATVRFGAVFINRKYYGAVRCGLQMSVTLRCGSARFSNVVKPTVDLTASNRAKPHQTDRKNRTVNNSENLLDFSRFFTYFSSAGLFQIFHVFFIPKSEHSGRHMSAERGAV